MANMKYLIQRVLDMDYKAMFSTINAIHKKTGRGRLSIFLDMKDCALKHGAGYVDYEQFELYDLTDEQRSTYLTRGRNNQMVIKYNDKSRFDDFDDKIKFNRLFSKFLLRDWVPVTGDNKDEVIEFLSKHSIFMAKPTHGYCGYGIEKLNTANFESLDAVYEYLLKYAPELELEEIIVQHPAVDAIYPGSINTIRLVTIRGKSGKVYPFSAVFRIGNGKFVDNFNSGGMVAPVDVEKGIVLEKALDKDKNLFESHPFTGTPIKGFQFPDWDKVIEMVSEAAQIIPEVGYVGWDVCFTPNGPCLVEGNQFPGNGLYQLPVHTPDKVGLMPRFQAIEDAESKL